MHIAHLSLFPDSFCSVLLDLTDDQTFFAGASRDSRLHALWLSYHEWCEQGGLQLVIWEPDLFCFLKQMGPQGLKQYMFLFMVIHPCLEIR